ncbi:MAG: hypothetical protein IJE78_06160 [Bacteroidaceae bacterium]|nr:hypothetical protein [Bacteroidaceae bacterium]
MLDARPIRIGYPSGKLKMTLWAGTEDEESFPIVGLNTSSPYCVAYGTKYYLTEDEIKIAKDFKSLL